MRFSPLVERINPEGMNAWAVHERASQRVRRGEDVILLSIGDPDFDTPGAIVETAVNSLRAGRTHYTPAAGELALRQAIAERQNHLWQSDIGAANVLVVPGAQCGLYTACMCALQAGDEVIIPEPTYVTYDGVIGAIGASIVNVPLRPERDFHLDPLDVRRAVSKKTRAVVLNIPHNPTGAVMRSDALETIAGICTERDLWLITDEVYAAMTFEHAHASPLGVPGLLERCMSVWSLSKSHAMTGWRIGWVVGSEQAVTHMRELLGCMLYGSPPFIQDAAITAVTADVPEVEQMRRTFRERRDLVCAKLAAIEGISCHRPEGGMFLMADIRGTALSAGEFANRLLDAHDVSVLPGEAFGASAAGHVRISLSASNALLSEACDRIACFVAANAERAKGEPS